MSHSFLRLASAVVLVGACVPAVARAAPPDDGAAVEVSRVDTTGLPHVVVEFTAPATLTGGPLEDTDVSVSENGAPVGSALTVVPSAGLEVVLVLDTSGSMKEFGALDAAKAATQRFLEVLPPEVSVGLVAFSDSARLVSALTSDRVLLNEAVAGLGAGGETALYDALVLAGSVFSGATFDRQIVLLSDGGNTVGSATAADALTVSTEIRTSVVELTSSEADPASLQRLADANRGTRSAVDDPAALTGMYESIADSLLRRYRLEFDATATGEITYRLAIATAVGQVVVDLATVTIEGQAPVAAGSTTVPASTVTTTTVPVATTPATTVADAVASSAAAGGRADPSMFASGTWLLIGAGTFFLALLIGLSAFTMRPSGSEPPRLVAMIRPSRSHGGHGVGERITGVADRLLDRGSGRRRLAAMLDGADINLRPGEFAVLCATGSVVLALLLSTVMSVPGLLVGLVLSPLAGWGLASVRADRRRRKFDEQLPDLLRLIITMLQSGFGLPQALDALSSQADEPAAGEFRRFQLEVRIGRNPTDALSAIAERMKSTDFVWVVSAVEINREVGGELVAALEAVTETVRERQRLERQVQALTAEGRLSAWILTALPVVLFAVLGVMNPGYFDPMKESPGPAMIVIGACLLVVGWVWMQRLIKTGSGGR